MFIAGWATCQKDSTYEISELCYTLYFYYDNTHNSTVANELPELVLRDYKPENDVTNNVTKHLIQEFVDLSKISLLFSTTATAVSHVLFIWALWCLYIKHYKCVYDYLVKKKKDFKEKCCGVESSNKDKLPIDPFNDDTEDSDLMETDPIKTLYNHKTEENVDFFSTEDVRTNTPLQGERLCHYVTWFIIGFMLLATTAIVFFSLYCKEDKDRLEKDTYNRERSALALYTYSLFRVLVSCFIFSKLMYGIQRRCEEIELFVYHINEVYKRNITPTGTNVTLSTDTNVTLSTDTNVTLSTGDKVTLSTDTNVTLPTGTNITLSTDTNVTLPTDTNVTLPTGTKVTLSTDTNITLPTGTNVTLPTGTKVELSTDTNVTLSTGTKVTLPTGTNVTLPTGQKLSNMVTNYLESIKFEVELNNFYKGIYITDKNAKNYLKARDRHFVDTAVSTLSWLQLWFLFHWILHIISTFMIMSLLIDAIALHVKSRISHIEHGVGFHPGEIGFLF
uniref:Uncharacterized protein n=2 Tax=Amphimedon queenslandica TaxID=400682 RepID=A0A1X7TJ85_AMPQE